MATIISGLAQIDRLFDFLGKGSFRSHAKSRPTSTEIVSTVAPLPFTALIAPGKLRIENVAKIGASPSETTSASILAEGKKSAA